MHEQAKEQVTIIGIPGQGDLDAMEDFVAATGTADVLTIPDLTGEIWERFGVRQRSQYLFIDDDGTAEFVRYGSPRGENLRDGIDRLIEG